MQTLERTEELAADAPDAKRRGRGRVAAAVVGGLVIAVVIALVAYGIGSSNTSTRVVVTGGTPKTPSGSGAASKAKPAAAPSANCLKGAAAGSCNTDEAIEAKIPDQPLNAATRSLLAQQLINARVAAMKYPTVADARAAGMLQAGQFSPQTGAHFIKYSALGNFDPGNPASYIYDGTSPTSKVIGIMYLSLNSSLAPEGFAGPNDHWHRHTNTCVVYKQGQITVPFAADSDVTKAQCDALHGDFMRETAWMVHAWVVPGWESPTGVFSHDNSDVLCADGTTKTDKAGFCRGT